MADAQGGHHQPDRRDEGVLNHAIIHLREERRRLMASLTETECQEERVALTREVEEVTAALVLIGSAPDVTARLYTFPLGHYGAKRATI